MQERDGVAPRGTAENPYSPDDPVRPGGPFFGREALIAYVSERLRPPDCRAIVLRGPRKIGKTSLLLHLERGLDPDRFLPAYVDLNGRSTQSVSEFYADLFRAVYAAAGDSPETTPAPLKDEASAVRAVLGAIEDVARGRRVVFLVDEFDLADVTTLPHDVAGNQAFPFFRRLERAAGGPAFVFALGRNRRPGWDGDIRAWLDSAPSREVGVLEEGAAKALIGVASAAGAAFTDLAKRTLLELTGGHPYFLQAFGARLLESATGVRPAERLPEPVGLLSVMATVPDMLESRQEGLLWIWDGLEPLEQAIARTAASLTAGNTPVGLDDLREHLPAHLRHLTRLQLEDILEQLSFQQVVRRHAPGVYGFVADLFRRWIARSFAAEWLDPPNDGRRVRDSRAGEALSDLADEEDFPDDTVEALWWVVEHGEGGGTPGKAIGNEGRDSAGEGSRAREEVPRRGAGDEPPVDGDARDDTGDGAAEDDPEMSSGERGPAPLNERPRRVRRPSREGQSDLERKISIPADSSELERLLQLGLNSFLGGRYEVAVASYRHALALQPGHVEATLGLARSLAETRNFTQALDVLRTLSGADDDLVDRGLAEVYLRWLDEVESDEQTWSQVMDQALSVLPEQEELLARKRGGRMLRIRRLLKNGKPLEAAAALGALHEDERAALADVQNSLLDTLEEMTRQGHADAGALFSLLRRQLPSPIQAWLRHLGPLLDEAERVERFNPARADSLFRAAASIVDGAGIDGADVPRVLMERLEAGVRRSETRRLVALEEQLEALERDGDLDQAERLLEEHLVESPSEALAARLESLRIQRQLLSTYRDALASIDRGDYEEARRLLSTIVSEMPRFVGPDGRSAVSVLEGVVKSDQGQRRRKGGWYVAGVATVVFLGLLLWRGPFSNRDGTPLGVRVAGGGSPPVVSPPVVSPTRLPGRTTKPGASDKEAFTPAVPGTTGRRPGPGGADQAPGGRNEPARPASAPGNTAGEQRAAVGGHDTSPSSPPPSLRPGGASPPRSSASVPASAKAVVARRRPSLVPSRKPPSLPSDIPSEASLPGKPSADAYEAALGGDGSGVQMFGAAPRRVTRADPAAARVYVGQGVHYEREGRLADALRSFQRAAELDPRSPEAHLGMGRVWLAQGKFEQAESELRTVIQLDLYGTAGREARRLLRELRAGAEAGSQDTP